MSKYEQLTKRFEKAKQEKNALLERLKEAYRYSLPSADVDGTDGSSWDERPEVYDDTAVLSLQKYANRLQAQLIPSWKTWALLKAGSDVMEDQKEEADGALEEITEVIFDHIHHSNFTSQAHEAFQDLGISTGALICEEGDGINSSLRFRAISMMELVPERSSYGNIKTTWREFKLKASEIKDLYPKATINESIAKIIEESPNTLIDLIEGVVFDEKENEYNHVLLYPKTKDVLLDETDESSPYIIFREQVSPNKAFGFGRVLQLLPTILKLNNLSYYEDVSVGINAAGVYTVTDDGVASPDNIRIQPFALIPVDSNDSNNRSIAPLDIGTNFNVTDVKIKENQAKVNELMAAQSFGNVEETPVRTAYEMSVRENAMQQNAHSAFGRLQTEFLESLLSRIVFVLSKAGKIPPLRVNGREVTLKFTSPSARVQDTEELQSLQEFLLYMESQPKEIVSAKFKIEDVPKFVAERTGLPASMMRNKAEEAEAVKGMQQAAMAGKQAETDASQPNVAPAQAPTQ